MFICDPETGKALCCKYDGRGLFALDLFVGEMELFHPKSTIFLLNLMHVAKTKEEKSKDYPDAYINVRNVFNDTRLPNFSLLFVVQALMIEEECPYLEGNKCSIYSKRPFICAVYPFINNEPGVADAFKRRDFRSFRESAFKKCRECCSSCGGEFRGFDEFFRERKKVIKKYKQKYSNILKEHKKFLLKLFRENLDSFQKYIRLNFPSNSWNFEFSIFLIKKIYGDEGIESQINAIEKALSGQLVSQEERKGLEIYKGLLESSI